MSSLFLSNVNYNTAPQVVLTALAGLLGSQGHRGKQLLLPKLIWEASLLPLPFSTPSYTMSPEEGAGGSGRKGGGNDIVFQNNWKKDIVVQKETCTRLLLYNFLFPFKLDKESYLANWFKGEIIWEQDKSWSIWSSITSRLHDAHVRENTRLEAA